MEYKKGQQVLINEDYILELYHNHEECRYNGISQLVHHIERGNEPVKVDDVKDNGKRVQINLPTHTGFNVDKKEIKLLKNNIRKL